MILGWLGPTPSEVHLKDLSELGLASKKSSRRTDALGPFEGENKRRIVRKR